MRLFERIEIDPRVCNDRPVTSSIRITVREDIPHWHEHKKSK